MPNSLITTPYSFIPIYTLARVASWHDKNVNPQILILILLDQRLIWGFDNGLKSYILC